MSLFAFLIGLVAFLFFISSVQAKQKKNLLICQLVANLFYGIQYILLNAIGAGLMNIVSVIRCAWFYYYDQKGKKIPVWIVSVLVVLLVIIFLFTYENFLSFIPLFITILYTISTYQKDMVVVRASFTFAGIIWLLYNASVGAWASLIGNIFEIISGTTSMIRFKKKKDSTR